MTVPSPRFIRLLLLWFLLGVAACLWPLMLPVWQVSGGLLLAAAVTDWLLSLGQPRITGARTTPGRMALGVEEEVLYVLKNPGKLPARVTVMDTLPFGVQSQDFPWTGTVPAHGFTRLEMRLQPSERGAADFGLIHVSHGSPLSLWARRSRTGETSQTRIYPNYEPVVRFALLSLLDNQAQMGIRHLNRPGLSREFRQLREYQDGDPLSRIDWKATSRQTRLISREYEEQRNQTIILAVDCGRRLRAMDGGLTQFDHCLNSLLLLSFIALRQGDHVGVMSFGCEPARWLPPVKGPHSMTTILNHLYDYQPGNGPGDFSEAAETILIRWPRRALVVIATNLRSEDETHLLPPLLNLRKKHLVVLASLRERGVTARIEEPVTQLHEAVGFASAHRYFEERAQVLERLRRAGIHTVDAHAADLPIALGNLYVSIKKRGLL
ncbi:MAG: hypothetical protein JWM59_4246 [Verrucomicrobiales bacterium]|nr:hypothetical protein [Verrucomicrobiales bacterium]